MHYILHGRRDGLKVLIFLRFSMPDICIYINCIFTLCANLYTFPILYSLYTLDCLQKFFQVAHALGHQMIFPHCPFHFQDEAGQRKYEIVLHGIAPTLWSFQGYIHIPLRQER